MTEHIISIAPDGTVRFIYSDELASLLNEGEASTRRASHVEPTEDGKHWGVDLSPVGGPENYGTFEKRADALQAEVIWLQANVL